MIDLNRNFILNLFQISLYFDLGIVIEPKSFLNPLDFDGLDE
jgi:hypothetical protein